MYLLVFSGDKHQTRDLCVCILDAERPELCDPKHVNTAVKITKPPTQNCLAHVATRPLIL